MDAGGIGERDVALLLDRVAEGQSLGRRAMVEAKPDFSRAGHVEIRALRREHLDDLWGRISLYRVIHAGAREIAAQEVVGRGHGVEIDDEAWRLGRAVGKETGDFLVHARGP